MDALDNKCPACGAPISFNPTNQMWDCEYCASKFTLEEMQNPEVYFDKIWKTLFNTTINLTSNQTLFDSIYDSLAGDEDSLANTYISELVKTAKSGLEIKKYEGRYDNLWK